MVGGRSSASAQETDLLALNFCIALCILRAIVEVGRLSDHSPPSGKYSADLTSPEGQR